MPDFWSHRFAAKKALEQFMKTGPTHLIWSGAEEAAFIFGAQGPDFFYYINKWKPFTKVKYNHIGNAIHHENPKVLIRCLLETLHSTPSKIQKAYISGFISHYVMDAFCHPLICKLGPDHTSHKRVEMDLEALCIFDYWGLSRSSLDVNKLKIDDISHYNDLSSLWTTTLQQLGMETIPQDLIINGHQSMLRIQKLIKQNSLRFLPFKELLGRIVNYDLSLLIFPDLKEGTLKEKRDYETFIHSYAAGIEETTNAFVCIEAILSENASIEDFINTFVKRDFLGEDI